jgi:hypothetical protein
MFFLGSLADFSLNRKKIVQPHFSLARLHYQKRYVTHIGSTFAGCPAAARGKNFISFGGCFASLRHQSRQMGA